MHPRPADDAKACCCTEGHHRRLRHAAHAASHVVRCLSAALEAGHSHSRLQFIHDHQLDLEQMITHRLELNAAEEAFRLADRAETGKVMFVWS